jgi:hypothetical protein
MSGQLGVSAVAARAHEEVFGYWSSLRREARLPSREDVNPFRLKRLLPTISLIDIGPDGDYRLRLAGTGLYSVYGREITGRTLNEVYSAPAAEYWREQLDKVMTERRPLVGCHNLGWRGAPHTSILWQRLPLARNGRDVDMILGYDAVVGSQTNASGIRAA